jgi:hypothetical protein
LVVVAVSREVFLQQPHPQRMHEAIVEMQFPIRGAGRPNAVVA